MDIISTEHNKKTKLEKMLRETNIEKFFSLLESPQKNDVSRHARDSKDNKTTQAFERNQRTDETIYREFHSSYFQKEKRLKM